MAITLRTNLSSLLTNKRRVSALKALGLITIADALTYYPFRVTQPVAHRTISEARIGQPMAFAARVVSRRIARLRGRRGFRLEALIEDDDFARGHGAQPASAHLVFFSNAQHYVDWLSARLSEGTRIVASGEPSEFNGQLQLTHPDILTVAPSDGNKNAVSTGLMEHFDAVSTNEALGRISRPRPVYSANSRISSEHIHDSILDCLGALQQTVSQTDAEAGKGHEAPSAGGVAETESLIRQPIDAGRLYGPIPDIIPQAVRQSRALLHRSAAIVGIHNPQSIDQFEQSLNTLRYEEAFVSQTSVVQARHQFEKCLSYPCRDRSLADEFLASLPFALTGGQQEVIDTILSNMGRTYPMHRLLQGEVGSGKTVVALASMMLAVGAGYQAVLVAPTQVLAEQHRRNIEARVEKLNVPVIVVTGGMRLSERRKALSQAASGNPAIIIATHAAFSKTFQAPRLALVVIDEQHRFGVEQRGSLQAKGERSPHLLVMTATPIPRTAAMTWFGDLDISWLTELPSGRKPIKTYLIREDHTGRMAEMFVHLRARIDAGERAYVVCPRIDQDDQGEATDPYGSQTQTRDDGEGRSVDDEEAAERPSLHSVEEMVNRLSSLPQFAGIELQSLTGRDDDSTKQGVMADFVSGKTPVLVATTVIEVGVDVPQASCIVIFDANHYGLSQLHQLRGRVGRGGKNSWAFLVYQKQAGSLAEQRLSIIEKSLDGAEIAQADLELRGAGDVLGDVQSGLKSSLKLLRVVQDAKIIGDARKDAEHVLAEDPELKHQTQLAGAVLDFTRGNETFIVSG